MDLQFLIKTRVTIEQELGEKIHPRIFAKAKITLIETIALPIDSVLEAIHQNIKIQTLKPINVSEYGWIAH